MADIGFDTHYIYLYYGNYAQQRGLINLQAVKKKLLTQQMGMLRAREKATLARSAPQVMNKAWDNLDAMLNLNSTDLTAAFAGPLEENKPAENRMVTGPGGQNYTIAQVKRLREAFAESTDIVTDLNAFAKSVENIIKQADTRFEDKAFRKALRAAVAEQLSNKGIQARPTTYKSYQALVKALLAEKGIFIDVEYGDADVISKSLLQLYALAEALKRAPLFGNKGSEFLGDPRGYKSKYGKGGTPTFLDTIFSKVNGWNNSIYTTTHELAEAAFLVESEVIGMGDMILTSQQKFKDVAKGRGMTTSYTEDPRFDRDYNNLKGAISSPLTIRKEDASITYSNGLVIADWGFNIKSSVSPMSSTAKRYTQLQSNTPVGSVLSSTGLRYFSRFLPELVATASGWSSGGKRLIAGYTPPGDRYLESFISQRWMEMRNTIGAAMTLNALSGYGAEGDRAIFFVYNNRLIAIRQIVQKIYQSIKDRDAETFIQVRGWPTSREVYKRMNYPVDSFRGRDDLSALARSVRAREIQSEIEKVQLTFNLAAYMGRF